jgi:hypothetical protein
LSPIILSMPNVSNGEDNPTPTACLASFFGKDNYVIILLQFTVICI